MGNWPGPTDDTRALQVTPVLTQDARPLPEVTISKKRRQARPSTYRTAYGTGRRRLKKTDAVDGRPYPPGRDGWEHGL